MRLIDADALIETWRKRACEDCDKRKGWKNGKTVGFIYDIGEAPCRACWVDDMLGELEDAPTVADAQEVRHGEWEIIPPSKQYTDGCYQKFRCSECDAVFDRHSLYCPSCWARMDGKENEDGRTDTD